MIGMDDKTNCGGRNLSAGPETDHGNENVLRIEETVAYMQQHLDQPLQVATLAAKANFSPSHFFVLFKRRVGSAPIDYFTRLRMERASRLLCETSLSVKEVAGKLGYDDPFYFSRVFKSVNRLAHSDYRAAQRKASYSIGEDPGRSRSFCEDLQDGSGRVRFAY
jgi:transcriptional regulator GlxA family with amidase domain